MKLVLQNHQSVKIKSIFRKIGPVKFFSFNFLLSFFLFSFCSFSFPETLGTNPGGSLSLSSTLSGTGGVCVGNPSNNFNRVDDIYNQLVSLPGVTALRDSDTGQTLETKKKCFACVYDIQNSCQLMTSMNACQTSQACRWDGKGCVSRCYGLSQTDCLNTKSCVLNYPIPTDGSVPNENGPMVCMPFLAALCSNEMRQKCGPTVPAEKKYDACKAFPKPPVTMPEINDWFKQNKCTDAMLTRNVHASPKNGIDLCGRVEACISEEVLSPGGTLTVVDRGCQTFANINDVYKYIQSSAIFQNACFTVNMYASQCEVLCGQAPPGKPLPIVSHNVQFKICKGVVTAEPKITCVDPKAPPITCGHTTVEGVISAPPTPPNSYCIKEGAPKSLGCTACKCSPVNPPAEMPGTGEPVSEYCKWELQPTLDECEKSHGPFPIKALPPEFAN